MGERAALARLAQLAVEVLGEGRQECAALLRQPRRIDLQQSQLGAQALAGAIDELCDGVLVQADELADLGVALLLELAEREHEPLAGLEARVRESHLVLLGSE